jgi:hypothetical protein
MWKLCVAPLAVALVVCGCSTVHKKPVEIEMPEAERHFIVMEPASAAKNTTTAPAGGCERGRCGSLRGS